MTLQKLALYISPFTMPLRQLVQKRESGMAIHVREEAAAAGNIPNAKKSFPIKNPNFIQKGKRSFKSVLARTRGKMYLWHTLYNTRKAFGTHRRYTNSSLSSLTNMFSALVHYW